MTHSPVVILAEPIEAEAEAWLGSRVNLVTCKPGDARFVEHLPEMAGLVVRTSTSVDEALLSSAPNLRVVARAGVGLDNIDVAACDARGIVVLSTPGANTQAVVEYVIAIVTNALRPREQIPGAVDTETWEEMRSSEHAARQMDSLCFGILGFGRIGSRVSEVAGAIGFETIYTDLLEIPVDRRHGARPVPIAELLSRSDVLSIHVDGRETNRGLLGKQELELLQDDVVLVNTSRGFVIKTEALAECLKASPAMRAILDVHEEEPVPSTCPLLGLTNTTLLPHTGARTETALANMCEVVKDLARHLGVE